MSSFVNKKTLCTLIVILCMTMSGCSQEEKNTQQDNIGIIKTPDTTGEKSTVDKSEPTPEVYEDEIKTVLSDNLVEWDTRVSYENIEYEVVSAEVSQSIGTRELGRINQISNNVDKLGNLTQPECYLWINIKVKNTTDEDIEVNLNQNTIVGINDKNEVYETAAEAVYIGKEEKGLVSGERFHIVLGSHQEKTVELGYWLDSEILKGNPYFCVGSTGSAIDDPQNNFLKLEEFFK